MKRLFKTILKVIGFLLLTVMILVGIFFYILDYRITKVDEISNTPYTIIFEEIGEPFLFGSAKGRVTLKNQHRVIQKVRMDVANDGARISKGNWKVEWNEEYVLVYIFQDEGFTMTYTFYYDPNQEVQIEINEPDQIPSTIPPMIDEEVIEENVDDKINLLELEESKEMILVADYLGYEHYEIRMDAKGKVLLETNDIQIKKNMDHEYVVLKGEVILGFYLVNKGTIIDEHKNTW